MMPILILFSGPTRTASTSLYFSQAPESLASFVNYHSGQTQIITKCRYSENPFLLNLRSWPDSFEINSYKKTFINPKASIFIDYCPMLFHDPAHFLRLSSTLSDHFESVIVVTFLRSLDKLVRSTLRYNLRNRHERTHALLKSNPDELIREICSFFDYQKWFDVLACSRVSCRFIGFDAFIADQPRLMSCLSESIVGEGFSIADAFQFPMPILNRDSILLSMLSSFSFLDSCLPAKLKQIIKDFIFILQVRHLLPIMKSSLDLPCLIPNSALIPKDPSVDDLIGRLKASMNLDNRNVIV